MVRFESYWYRLCNNMPVVSFRPDLKPWFCVTLTVTYFLIAFPIRDQNIHLNVWVK